MEVANTGGQVPSVGEPVPGTGEQVQGGVPECLIISIPDGTRRGWRFEVDGKEVPFHFASLTSPRFGTLGMGKTAAGYDGWCFHEVGGGGSVIPMYAIIKGHIYIGVVSELRPLTGGWVLNVPRGFGNMIKQMAEATKAAAPKEVLERPEETARRELMEETGLTPEKINSSIKSIQRDKAGVNMNSAFFVANPENGEGVHFLGISVQKKFLKKATDKSELERQGRVKLDSKNIFEFKEELVNSPSLYESIKGVRFIQWEDAIELSDGFTNVAVGKIIKHVLLNKGLISNLFVRLFM